MRYIKLKESRELLTKMRNVTATSWWGSTAPSELEKEYGQYTFVPFHIPKIVPQNLEEFLEFYKENSKVSVRQTKGDVSGYGQSPQFFTLDTEHKDKSYWSTNYSQDFKIKFKEIFEQIYEYLPGDPTGAHFKFWSSFKTIGSHRDESPMVDLPLGIRIKIYDNNEVETLYNIVSPVDKTSDKIYRLPIPDNTNSFAWNNLRVRHGSTYSPGNQKILILANFTNYNWKKYRDLLEKSISMYNDYCVKDNKFTINDYVNT